MTRAPDQSDAVIGRAVTADAPAIADLCRSTFRRAPEWQAPRSLSHRWWRQIIASDGCPVHVARDPNGRLLGFVIEIIDPTSWTHFARIGPNRKSVKLLTAILHPAILRSRLRKAKRARAADITPTSSAPSPQPPASAPPAAMFLELLVVVPEAAGKGVARGLLETLERNAASRGHKRVELLVDPRNARAQAFYRKHGYQTVSIRGSNSVMTKALTPSPARDA